MTDPTPSYGGPCRRCGHPHALPSSPQAVQAALQLRDRLDARGHIDADAHPRSPALRITPATDLTLGMLLTREGPMLKAFSGQFAGESHVPGWAQPLHPRIFTQGRRTPEEEQLDALGDRITQVERQLAENRHHTPRARDLRVQKQALKLERKRYSQQLTQVVFQQTVVRNFRGEAKTLPEVFDAVGIPGGTGDCCAPKLLQAAIHEGLTPTSMVEFRFSPHHTEGPLATRAPCDNRCRPLLGYMLCGLDINRR